ncbi:MAG TPA: type II toxin-antitoxin system prevent-host-death family antitoxin [Caulobacteraceae bacterium]|nr:type II toxin-antitoxin system prevent-host-death family antitoxin [Caulobacteraceae bacterium]
MSLLVSLYEAKTKLSALVERAAAGEEIVITKNGKPQARLVPIPFKGQRRSPAQAMGVTFLAEDFDAPDPRIEALFTGNG